jgi:hypothetical protein
MSAYDTLRLRLSWNAISSLALLSMVLFLGSLPLLVRAYRGFHFWAWILWIVLPLVSLLGTAAGTVAFVQSRRDPAGARGGVAALVLVLNATILLSCIVAVAASRLF